MEKKKQRQSISAFSILFLLLIVLGIITWFIPSVENATLSTVVMAPYNGFTDAVDVIVFVLVLGGFLGVVNYTGALSKGIANLVKKMKGKELILIPILMFLFSIGGTTYGMAEETVAFYAIIVAAMVTAGFDAMVGASVVLLGAGVGVLGSTVNPFAAGIATDSVNKALEGLGRSATVNNGIVIGLGIILWLTSFAIACFFVMRYAKKVLKDKGSTILSLQEQEDVKAEFEKNVDTEDGTFTAGMKASLIIFGLSFVVMIISVIPWGDFGVTIFDGWSSFLTGAPLGGWWFGELAMWFFLVAVVVAVISRMSENVIIKAFIDGSKDMMGVALIIAVARGASVLMTATKLDSFILESLSSFLSGVPAFAFAPLSYGAYGLLSFLIPSTSGLATVSMPIMGPLTFDIGFNPAVMIMIFSAASGLINLFTPTSGVVMGGLAISRIQYSTWLKFVGKILGFIILANVIILTIAMMIL